MRCAARCRALWTVRAAILLLTASACDSQPAAQRTADNPTTATAPSASQPEPSAEIDRLRAMPYAGFAENADEKSGVDFIDPQRSYPGYSLYTVHFLCIAELIDENGRLMHRWSMDRPSRNWGQVTLLPDGDLLVIGADAPATAVKGIVDDLRYVMRLAWDGSVRWRQTLPAHHDIQLAPDGRLAVLTLHRRELSEVNRRFETRDDHITWLDGQDGRVLDSASLLDMLQATPGKFALERVAPERFGGSVWLDVLHTNALAFIESPALAAQSPLYASGNVLVCFRHQNRIAIVNPAAKELVWSWGQGELRGPHDPSLLPDGNILIYDNGLGRGWSRVIELDPRSERIVWEYKAPTPTDFLSNSKGSCQRLPNGNTLIANSDSGQAFEVTRAGEIVWNYYVPHRNDKGQRAAIVRCYRYERAQIDAIIARNGGVTVTDRRGPPGPASRAAASRPASGPARRGAP